MGSYYNKTDDELAHFGVKGMRWGVRNAYANRIEKKNFYGKVANGTASRAEKVVATLHTPAVNALTKKGRQKHAAAVDTAIKEHVDRVRNGKRTVLDVIGMYGRLKMSDIVKGAMQAKNAPK